VNYDQRNSAKLLATHMEVITRIDRARRNKTALRVLDLGGGTGQNVATYFADINPAYAHSHPFYRATAADGTPVAIHTRPVQPSEVATRTKEARLQLSEMTEIEDDEVSYSFIITFVNPAQRDDDYPHRESAAAPL
jgi:hypothetical protein